MRISALLVVLLACATATIAEGAACDAVSCGMGTCKELPPPLLPIPSYECDCYPGWANFVSLPLFTFTACYIPTCPLGLNCYVPTFKLVPPGSNLTLHPCLGMDCGTGTCVEEQDKPLRCQCEPGAANLLSLPCSKDCVGSQNGCKDPNPPPPPCLRRHRVMIPIHLDRQLPPAPKNLLLLALLAALHVVV